jgi:DNA-binding transcriptional regulator WhiA
MITRQRYKVPPLFIRKALAKKPNGATERVRKLRIEHPDWTPEQIARYMAISVVRVRHHLELLRDAI